MKTDIQTTSETWMRHMRRGEFEQAWAYSDKVLKSGINRDYFNLPRHFQCIWDGTPLNGKRVLIRCYHGLGDTIQFIRFAPLVKKIASQVMVWAQPPILDLLKTADGIDKLLPLHNGTPDTAYDVDVEIMELPHVFRTTLATIPLKIPYLHVDAARIASNKKLKVGLVWQAGDWDQSRNIPFQLLKPLIAIEGVAVYILQEKAVTAGWEEGFGIFPGDFNLLNYARFIAGLDLMITVDSMPAHLAGALNIPVWLMLQADADWRWMENRTDSPWYPAMKLFRQEKQGKWDEVVEKVNEKLRIMQNQSNIKI